MKQPRKDSDLRTWLDTQYFKLVREDATQQVQYQYGAAVSALGKAVGRRARICDLTSDGIEATYSHCLQRGLVRSTAMVWRNRLWTLRKFLFPDANQEAETIKPDRKYRGRVLTLAKAFETIYLPFIEATVAPMTITTYRAALRSWDRYGSPKRDVRHLAASDFGRFVSVYEKDHAPASVNGCLRHFRAILRFLHSEGIVDRIPQLRPVRVPEVVKPRPTFEQVGQLYAAIREAEVSWRWPEWWETFIVLAFVGGLRLSELRALRWDDITDDGIELHRPKTARLTFVPPVPVVDAHLAMLRETVYEVDSRVLPAPGGSRQFYAEAKRIGDKAGIDWSPHALRRASVDNWTATDTLAGQIVGHSTLHVAFRHYLDKRAYLAKVAERLPIPSEFACLNGGGQ
ncbi:MAG: tyrosine-type recombinase/integrase [Planctomycetaceae bacterium]